VAINDLRSRREAQGDTPASGVGGGTPPTSERAGRDAVSYRKRPRAGMASDVRKPDRIWHRLPLSVQGVISFIEWVVSVDSSVVRAHKLGHSERSFSSVGAPLDTPPSHQRSRATCVAL
jgi:hypothetical protein